MGRDCDVFTRYAGGVCTKRDQTIRQMTPNLHKQTVRPCGSGTFLANNVESHTHILQQHPSSTRRDVHIAWIAALRGRGRLRLRKALECQRGLKPCPDSETQQCNKKWLFSLDRVHRTWLFDVSPILLHAIAAFAHYRAHATAPLVLPSQECLPRAGGPTCLLWQLPNRTSDDLLS